MNFISLVMLFFLVNISFINANQRQYPYPDDYDESSRWVVRKVTNKGAEAPDCKKNKIDRRTGAAIPHFLYMGKFNHKDIPTYPNISTLPTVTT